MTQQGALAQVDVLHRLNIDKAKFGRNEYNDLYHWAARYSMLEKLAAEGNDKYNVVFMDPDVLVRSVSCTRTRSASPGNASMHPAGLDCSS